jgi:hypothetical protein
MCIFVRIFVHICVHSFCRCHARFGAYPNYIGLKCFVKTCCKCFKKKNRKQNRWGLMLGFAYLMPDCRLEVTLHSEGPETGQIDQGFPWSPLDPEQMLSWYQNFTFTACFTCSPPSGSIKNFALMYPSYCRIKILPIAGLKFLRIQPL